MKYVAILALCFLGAIASPNDYPAPDIRIVSVPRLGGYEEAAPAPVLKKLKTEYQHQAPLLKSRDYEYEAPALKSTYQHQHQYQHQPAPAFKSQSEHIAIEAPHLKATYEAPHLKSSYEAPILKSSSYGGYEAAPAPAFKSSSYGGYEAAPVLKSSSYGYEAAPALKATNYEYEAAPVLKSSGAYQHAPAPVLKSSNYEYEYEPVAPVVKKAQFVPIVKYLQNSDNYGTYNLQVEGGDGQSQSESGNLKHIKTPDSEGPVVVKDGSYSWTSPEGQTFTVNYVADENGFRATGAHLPTPQ